MVKVVYIDIDIAIDESCRLMQIVYLWKFSFYESCLLMEVKIVKEVMASDVSPVTMFLPKEVPN